MDDRAMDDEAPVKRRRLGWRLIGWAWVLLVVFCLVGLTGAREMVGRFGRGLIEVRHWMNVYNTVVSGAHLLVLGLLLAGVSIVARAASSRRIAWALWRSWAAFAGAALFSLGLLGFTVFVRPPGTVSGCVHETVDPNDDTYRCGFICEDQGKT